jgi:DNA-binding response OmpR family regulator
MPVCRECGAAIEVPTDPYFDDVREDIVIGDERRHVWPTIWNILLVLRSRSGRIVTAEFLLKSAYGSGHEPTAKGLAVALHRLRRQLVGTPYQIVTEPGRRGFRFDRISD